MVLPSFFGKEPHISVREIGRDRRRAEYIFEAAPGDIQCSGVPHHERYAVALGDRRSREGAGRLISAHQRVDLVLSDEPGRQLLGERWIALMIDEDNVEFCAAEMRQPGTRGERNVAEFRM